MEKKSKVLGMILIFIAMLLVGFFIKSTFFDKEEIVAPESKNTQEESKESKEEAENTVQNENTIDEIDTTVKYDIPEGIQKRIDLEKFDEAFRSYLQENNLYTENTKAVSDEILTENFDKGYISFDLKLNNYNSNTIICVMNDDGSYEFDYY